MRESATRFPTQSAHGGEKFCRPTNPSRGQSRRRPSSMAQHNCRMADRIACSCVTRPKCGTWVVVTQRTEMVETNKKVRESCPVPECGREFEFETGETRVFEVPLPLFERRHFYRSELR